MDLKLPAKTILVPLHQTTNIKVLPLKSAYNACINKLETGFRLFYRDTSAGIGKDRIKTCILTDAYEIIDNTTKEIKLISRLPKVVDGDHVEDPRVILHQNNWFLSYTDGYKVAIAKLDYFTCDTIYVHYLPKPEHITFTGGDGREKNWIPFSRGDEIIIWYSDFPRTLLYFKDEGASLVYTMTMLLDQKLSTAYGSIRGGCSPVKYDDEHDIWFFHTNFNSKYHMGAYLTNGNRIVAITQEPILTGNPIIFPCGAVSLDDRFVISMGIQDRCIGIMTILRSQIKFHPELQVELIPV